MDAVTTETQSTQSAQQEQAAQPTTLTDMQDQLTETAGERHEEKRKKQAEKEAQELEARDEHLQTDHDLQEEAAENTLELPEKLQGYSQKAVAELMDAYGLDENDLANPKIQAMLAAKLEEAAGEEEAEGETEDQDEENPEEKTEAEQTEQPAEEQKVPANREEAVQQHLTKTWERVQKENDPEIVAMYKGMAREIFGAETPEAIANSDRMIDGFMLGTQGMIDSQLQAQIPRYLQHYAAAIVESVAPGLREAHFDAVAHNTWESLRNSGKFTDLPAYGTPEFDAAANKLHADYPFLNTITFKDEKGRPLPFQQALQARAELSARLLNGEKFTPAMIQQTFEKGKTEANRTNRRVSAGRMLGSGRSTGTIGRADDKPEGGSLMDAYKSQHGSF